MAGMRPIAVIGSSGQVARALIRAAETRGIAFVAGGRADADLTDAGSLKRFLEKHRPSIVINAAAYTAVDKAESEPDLARRINADGPAMLATMCSDARVPMIHISTDYVFDGSKTAPYEEDDARAPLNVYGRTKLLGEDAVAFALREHLIVRTSWVYDATGHNFLNTMLRLGAERPTLRVVADQFGAPTFAGHLAQALLDMAGRATAPGADVLWGTYHVTSKGETTWHGFAGEIFRHARETTLRAPSLEAISSADYSVPAARPKNSRLDCGKFEQTFGLKMPGWRVGVAECMSTKTSKPLERVA